METKEEKSAGHGVAPHSSEATKATLVKAPVHDSWVSGFRTSANEQFFARAIGRIVHVTGASAGERILDAGCGSGTKTLLLAARGLDVTGADFSDYVLDKARAAAEVAGLANCARFSREDLLALSFDDGYFPYVFCWGVVMHIPDYERALDELVRVVRPGGYLILSEGNMYSVQSVLLRWIKKALGRQRAEIIRSEIGLEFWEETSSGRLMTRQTNIKAMVRAVEKRGMRLEKRFAGQFSELYMLTGNTTLQRLFHGFNAIWFRWIRTGRLAYGNLLVFRKPEGVDT